MIDAIKNIYLKKWLLVGSAIVANLCWIFLFVTGFANPDYYPYAVEYTIFFLLTLGLFIAYIVGSINIQKMLFGSLLLMFIISDVIILFGNTLFVPEPADTIVIVGTVFVLALSVAIYIAHMLQQTDHFGTTKTPFLNQCCGIIIVMNFIYLVIAINDNVIANIAFMLGSACTYIMIICMETRIHEYKKIRKQNREAGTWTEEERAKAKQMFKL